jgi:hypothetical protein
MVGHRWGGRGSDREYRGAIFNMDGSTYKPEFHIGNGDEPFELAVGPDRFFIAYASKATLLDWDGDIIWEGFTTMDGYFPVGVVQTGGKFYLLLSPESEDVNCLMLIYDLDANVVDMWDLSIPQIKIGEYGAWGSGAGTRVSEGDMALSKEEGTIFIVWWDKKETKNVYGIVYDLNGNVVKNQFIIKENIVPTCKMWGTKYVNPLIAAGKENYLITFKGKLFLYDISSLDFVAEKDAMKCVHDLAYGGGKYLMAENQPARFYDEQGNLVGTGQFGGHGDQITTLAYGNHMFVGVVAVHLGADGIGISFLTDTGIHLIDVLAIKFPEAPGKAAYDW